MSPESPYPGPGGVTPGGDGAPTAEPAAPVDAAPAEDTGTTPPAPPTCKVCGCELDPDQSYCLECGSPTPLAPRLRRGGGGLAAVALGLVVLGAGAGALAAVAAGDDGPTSAPPAVSTSQAITVPTDVIPTTTTDSSLPGDTTGTLPTDTSGLYTDTSGGVDTSGVLPTDTTATTGGSDGLLTVTGPGVDGQTTSELPTTGGADTTASGGIDDGTGSSSGSSGSSSGSSTDWPAGTSGWTAIVSSVRNESAARSAASRLQSQGEPGGVLFSTDHPPLNPGYWVVFSGQYTTKTEALSHAQSLVAKWPGAYPRHIES